MPEPQVKISPDRVRIILDSIADGLFTVDNDLRITFFNRTAEQIMGISRDQAVGSQCSDIFNTNICKTAEVLRQTVQTGREFVNWREEIRGPGGKRVPVNIITAVLRDEEGRTVGGVATFRDLSEIETLRKAVHESYQFEDIISKNHELRKIFDILPDVAAMASTVLIEGPSGSGKELFARAIHNLSPRRTRPFVAVNCGALPDTLLESELFGYVRGAFTDAYKDKPGRFALAEGGTLFLDEIGDISTALQVKLLRVLDEKQYEPLGATKTVRADVRIIVATNRPLAQLVAQGKFRDDLYYRLNVVRLSLPPLARRREDIPLLVEHVLARLNAENEKTIAGISAEALALLMRYDYPGNVRELSNIVERAFVVCREQIIDVVHLPAEIVSGVFEGHPRHPVPPKTDPLGEAEVEAIIRTLEKHRGNRTHAAAELGINRATLWRKMKKYGIGA